MEYTHESDERERVQKVRQKTHAVLAHLFAARIVRVADKNFFNYTKSVGGENIFKQSRK